MLDKIINKFKYLSENKPAIFLVAIIAALFAVIAAVATVIQTVYVVIDHIPKLQDNNFHNKDDQKNSENVINTNPSSYELKYTYKMPNGYLVTIAQTDNVALNTIVKALGASRQISPSDPNVARLHITEVSINTSTIVGDCTPLYAELNYQLLLPNRMDQTIRTAHSKKQICLNRQPDWDKAEELVVSDAVNDLLQQLSRS